MTPDIQAKVDALAPGEYVTVAPSVRAFRRRDNTGVTFSVKSNRPGMPNGAQQVTFDNFADAVALTRKIGVTQRVAINETDAVAKYFAGFAAAPTADDADNSADCASLADVPFIDPLLNALDDAHKIISDATVDGDIANLRAHATVYAQICETLCIVIGSSRTP